MYPFSTPQESKATNSKHGMQGHKLTSWADISASPASPPTYMDSRYPTPKIDRRDLKPSEQNRMDVGICG